jgi:hypothetical protein
LHVKKARLLQKSCEVYHAGNGGGVSRAKIAVPPAAAGRQEKGICYTIGNSVTWRRKSIMKDPVKMGRHAEIVPMDGSHYVVVDGQQWSRHDDLAKAEALRNSIVEEWAAEYERRMDKWMSDLATDC